MSHVSKLRSAVIVLALAATAAGEMAFDVEPIATTEPGETGESIEASLDTTPAIAPESIDDKLIDAAARPAGILKYGPVSLIDPLWKKGNEALSQIGLKVGFAYTAVYQVASGGPGDRDLAGGDVDFFGDWRLLGEKDSETRGYLYFATEQRHQLFSDLPPGSMGGTIGSLWGTTNGFGEQDYTVKELFWQQHFGGDRLLIRVGKLDAENYYNSNYWQSDAKYFMNAAFSSFPVRAFPSNGLGVNATVKLSKDWYVSAGAQDAQGKKTTAGFDTLFEDWNLFSAVEVGFTPTIEGLGKGSYRFTPWYRDAGERTGTPHDAGFTISFDQHVGEHFIPFFRAGTGDGNIKGVAQMISAGVGWEGKIISDSDVVGVAGAWGNPSDSDLNDQFATEIFYRLQASPDNQITVGYQVIFEPSNDPDHDVVGVFELRWRITF